MRIVGFLTKLDSIHTMKKHILVYRDNSTWSALCGDLLELATSVIVLGKGRTPKAAEAVVQVFPVATTEEEIGKWVSDNRELISQADGIFADATTQCQIASSGAKQAYQVKCIDKYLAQAADTVFKGKDPSDVYRQILALAIPAASSKQVRIVIDRVADYNPLHVEGFNDAGGDLMACTSYAKKFAELVPEGVTTELIRIEELTLPDSDTLVIVHHHALNRRSDGGSFHESPRVWMPYPKGFVEKAARLCDISSVVKGDVLETARKLITG